MTIEFICDYCDWQGDPKDYTAHIKDNPKCDDRLPCCKVEEIEDYNEFEIDEICEDCTKIIHDYYEDQWTDALMESYYEGR
jgi:hypothetical protein